jgi:hypothetical protein
MICSTRIERELGYQLSFRREVDHTLVIPPFASTPSEKLWTKYGL